MGHLDSGYELIKLQIVCKLFTALTFVYRLC